MTKTRLLLSTINDSLKAEKIARTLVSEQLAACVNIVPGLTSIYRWQSKIECDSETLLIIKTSTDRVGELMGRLREIHPYEVPEIVAFEVSEGNPDYLLWVQAATHRLDN